MNRDVHPGFPHLVSQLVVRLDWISKLILLGGDFGNPAGDFSFWLNQKTAFITQSNDRKIINILFRSFKLASLLESKSDKNHHGFLF